MNREQCKGCAYFRTADGTPYTIKFCHHYLYTGIRRKVGDEEVCLSKSKKARRLCMPFEAPIAQI